jgi:hypothetical protein
MSAPAGCKLIGRRRIIEADIRDRDHLDLRGAATITITVRGLDEIAFGALRASLDIEYSRAAVGFTWEGSNEMDGVRGDGSIEIELAYHNGDEAVLKAKRDTSSTACQSGTRSHGDVSPSSRGAKRRSNPPTPRAASRLDCFAPLAMTISSDCVPLDSSRP